MELPPSANSSLSNHLTTSCKQQNAAITSTSTSTPLLSPLDSPPFIHPYCVHTSTTTHLQHTYSSISAVAKPLFPFFFRGNHFSFVGKQIQQTNRANKPSHKKKPPRNVIPTTTRTLSSSGSERANQNNHTLLLQPRNTLKNSDKHGLSGTNPRWRGSSLWPWRSEEPTRNVRKILFVSFGFPSSHWFQSSQSCSS